MVDEASFSRVEDDLNAALSTPVQRSVSLKELSRWKIGGVAAGLIEPKTTMDCEVLHVSVTGVMRPAHEVADERWFDSIRKGV